MTTDGAVELFRNAIMIAALVGGPPLLVAVIQGLVGLWREALLARAGAIRFAPAQHKSAATNHRL